MKYLKKAIVPAVWGIAFLVLMIGIGSFPKLDAWGVHPSSRMSESRVLTIFQENLPPSERHESARLARALLVFSKKYHLDPAFVVSVIYVESTFNPKAVSPVGAIGLMQLMPPTARAMAHRYEIDFDGSRAELFDPVRNLELGMAYLKELMDRYKGKHPYYALAAYNMGPARLNRLMSRPGFKPRATLKYYQDVTRGTEYWRYYESRVEAARFSGAKNLAQAVKKGPNGLKLLAENTIGRPVIGRP